MTVSQKIFKIMQLKGLKQKDLSEATGIAPSTISEWKRKNIVPSSESLTAIAKFLNVSTDFLLDGEENLDDMNSQILNNSVLIHGNANHSNVVNATSDNVSDELVKEFAKIVTNLSSKNKFELMHLIYDFEENCKKEAK